MTREKSFLCGAQKRENPVRVKHSGVEKRMNKPHGGHGMTVAVSHVVLGHEDIMVLPTRTVTIVEAPGEGKMVCPVAALFEADTVAGAYGSVGPGQILLSLGTDRSGAWWDFADGSSSRDLFVEARKSVQLSGCFVHAQPVGDVSEAENLHCGKQQEQRNSGHCALTCSPAWLTYSPRSRR